jgi:peptidoglycan biosynthesis protein MviN/MurJ (putative lipid II flippase)
MPFCHNPNELVYLMAVLNNCHFYFLSALSAFFLNFKMAQTLKTHKAIK